MEEKRMRLFELISEMTEEEFELFLQIAKKELNEKEK